MELLKITNMIAGMKTQGEYRKIILRKSLIKQIEAMKR